MTKLYTTAQHQRGVTSWVLVLFVMAIMATAIVAVLLGHKIGYQRGAHSIQAKAAKSATGEALSAEQVEALKLKNEILANDVATAKQELAISLSNVDELRRDDETLKISNRQLEQVNEVFASYIASKGGLPLKVIGVKMAPLPENAFEYRFDVAMVSPDGSAKTLTPTLTLLNDDSLVEVPLDPKRYDINGVARIRGRFMMPEGFKPMQVKLTLKAGSQSIEQLYDWQLGSNVEDMPLSLAELPEVDENPVDNTVAEQTNPAN
ncbi:MAG: hypothetical protein Q4P13_01630 [Psychrobacter sp.]|nr:hypothetical protein [Psychrobacter sp.]